MSPQRSPRPGVICYCLLLWLAGRGYAGEHVLVIGDSLSKEYQSEFVALYPDNPAAWTARNWNEILDARRNDKFDLGSWAVYPDVRLTGHEFNWSKPGGTAREFRNFLRQDSAAEAEIKASSAGPAAWLLFPSWRSTFTTSTEQVEKVVIFFGGNDLALGNSDPVANPDYNGSPRQIDYESIYAGTFGNASDPDLLRTSIRSNIKSIIEWFRNPRTYSDGSPRPPRFPGPMVLCAVPHVGCTPKVQAEAGTDPARTAVLTQMIELLNAEIRDFAQSKNVAFANVYPITRRIMDPAPFTIGGITFHKAADADCRPRYLFSGDGFHPNTAVHALVAQTVADAFRSSYAGGAGDVARLTDREIVTDVLGLARDTGYREWIASRGVPAASQGPLMDPDQDGLLNLMEYALSGRDPGGTTESAAFTAVRTPHPEGFGEVLTVTWLPRFPENAYCDLEPRISTDLLVWQPVPPENVFVMADGTHRVELNLGEAGALYFRLAAVVP